MNKEFRKPLLPVLLTQQNSNWQQFCEQYPEIATEFSTKVAPQRVADFKQAIALSDFIYCSALQAPEVITALFASDDIYQATKPNYQDMLNERLASCDSEEILHHMLRQFRMREMVAIAFADMILDISLDESLSRLSALADSLILSALNWLSHACYKTLGKPLNRKGELQPLLVYGMGKLGGRELNFSSDIDLIFVYPEAGETQGGRKSVDNHNFFTRLGQKLITALNQKTADGFVYRVDMRLRPFGDSGPLVLSFNAMEDYYQEQGRDWERYAMLKARLIGEGKYHGTLSSMLRPFVYRRYIDFSVIDSLRRMKMMIAQEVRRKQLNNNIKLGAGGIREIEFIVQVFQLIRGGRTKALQQRNLLSVLPELVNHEEISEHSKQVLEKAYRFLRRVENIVQALHDEQTQTLPDSSLDQSRLLHVLGDDVFPSWPQFLAYTHKLMAAVHQEFTLLIGEESPSQQDIDDHWADLWDGDWSKEETIDWISNHEKEWHGEKVYQLLIDFKRDIDRRSIGSRGRQVLDKLMPQLLTKISDFQANERCIERVMWILAKIATRTAYLELLFENVGALKHLVKLCHASHWMAEHIAKYPIILDELIDPKLLHNPPTLDSYANELRQQLLRIPEDDLEAQMESLRQFKQAQQLRIAAADIADVLPVTKVSDHLTALAEAVIAEVINMAWQQTAEKYGVPSALPDNNKGFAVIGYGKVGGIELSYSSDLDLVFVHNHDINDMTNGVKQVAAGQFYAKVAQRMMHIFNTRTASGILYELDMRLRPSGNSGVLVVSLPTFAQYQHDEAWTWEHQALVRARVVYGDEKIASQFNKIRCSVLAKKRELATLKQDVINMREKMRNHLDKSDDTVVDIKQGKGGLVDIEFLAQYLVLSHGSQFPEICYFSDNLRIFKALSKYKVIEKVQQQALAECYCQLRDFGHKTSLQQEENKLPKQKFDALTQPIITIINQFFREPPSGSK
ncbi:bifunctional [glutamate--ammonia ligase]-adenylyl-L-tyrosine phosphorylase/[glutamate--ammonia-ligase] adenylyltransferase [Thalassotalea sp. PP2-459]|uniref:bifunctional [glutamate--ammonia ligase]-adenylyl-L-tyrosine phosphorylase/[glutamate--ammonia-ligase] adenylyltransferase n=1 Tax=Thalassotalea sp. PP2-459 TaxID=1742724 RepID=UPI0009425CBC|nr:bifunctional [glutamate--ammonia ligase]-adenylyl-L-tyrosine phosphorylase/[glutamate--ammonia-ligase] adenylyltransferase [Thalassotalea sp. PP2-459]OKY25068.1 bifunctional glutamine synthetase adenylyltransferase/deadenyltransferase [Thalassotalea sp. PP2-459]